MCGIVGSVNASISSKTLDFIKHRGPDFQSLLKEEVNGINVYLGHTRLSILDLSEAGNQPMVSNCGNYSIIFNGEVYNHLQLRERLNGIHFKGHSDTETLLYYIREFGIESINDLNGIFAFGFLDKTKRKLYLARDHFGVKPLYYYQCGKTLVFGSELKTILENDVYNKELDLHALNTFLTFRYNPAPDTVFKKIFKLPAAHYIEYDLLNGSLELIKYWNDIQRINYSISKEEAIERYRLLLRQAVKRQLLSDVPVGLLLSGGIDSAVLGSLMTQYSDKKINSFTIGFEGKGDYNELEYARQTADIIGSDHYEVMINKKDYFDYFHKSFYHVEEPIAESTIPALFCVSKLASEHVKVVLSGQGIDEPMGGYKRYIGEQLISKHNSLLPFIPLSFISKIFPRNHAFARGIHAAKFKNDLDRFIGICTIYTEDLKDQVYSKEMAQLKRKSQRRFFEPHYSDADQFSNSLSKLLYIDTRTMLPDDLLLFNDKITMANSLENRVPFLDIDLIKFIESLPTSYKINGKTGKFLHREAVKDIIPSGIINRKKRGFATPVDEWFQNELSATLNDLVSSRNSFSSNYFNISAIQKMIELHRKKKHNYKHELFMTLSLELWYKNFYQNF